MEENTFRRFSAVMRVLTAIGAVIVFFVGIQRFHVEQTRLVETRIQAEKVARDREFRRELWLRQLDTLSSVASAASRIAASVGVDSVGFEAAVQEYEALYWGNVIFVENTDLMSAMDALRHEIRYLREGLVPVDGLSLADKIKQRAHGVALACSRVIQESGREFTLP
jgi:hypothetical protein